MTSQDFIRRESRDIQDDHTEALGKFRRAMPGLFHPDSPLDADTKLELVAGFSRRRILQIGGMGIMGAAVLAACGSDDSGTSSATTAGAGTTMAPGTTAMAGASSDVVLLRTASSLEELAVAAYQTAIDSGLVTTPAVGDAAKLFQAQHREHSALFQAATKTAGGQPFTMPNPVVLQMLQPTIAALKDQAGVLKLAYDLETAAAQTYQSAVGLVSDAKLNVALMSVGGVEARHAAVLASVLMQPPAPKAFQTIEKAVAAGTGV